MNQDRMISVAADYADALLVARRVKRTMLLLLALILVVQIAMFATAQFSDLLPADASSQSLAATDAVATTMPLAHATPTPSATRWPDTLHYVSTLSLYAAMIAGLVLIAMLALTVHIMLVGRLVGVALVTRAFVLAVLLWLLMFPWQTLLVTHELGRNDIVIPGVLYTWDEIQDRVLPLKAPGTPAMSTDAAILYWARFLALPIAALILVLMVQKRSGRGLKLALGEEEILPASDEHTGPASR